MPDPPPPCQIDSWVTAERNAADWMRHWGYRDAKVTPSGPDAGIDVRASDALAQVKWEAAQTGSPAVQRLVGARRLDHHKALLFFSGAGYSTPAIEYADDMDIALFKYALDGRITPVSLAAHRLVLRAKRETESPPPEPASRPQTTASETTAAAPQRLGAKRAGRGWWGRNWTAAVAVVWFLMAAQSAFGVIRDGNDSTWDWWDPLFYLAVALPFALVWLRTRDKRKQWSLLDQGIDIDAYRRDTMESQRRSR